MNAMTLEVIEVERQKVHFPARDVAAGLTTFEKANREYRGCTLPCLHCWRILQVRSGDLIEQRRIVEQMLGSTLESELLPPEAERTAIDASFRRGTFSPTGEIKRWMHFAHKTGRMKGSNQRPCHDPDKVDHSVAVGVFKLWLEEEYKSHKNIEIVPEKRLIIQPGDPPITRKPDLAVYRNDLLERVLEIQRSPISIDDLVKRTMHLETLSPTVEWYFARGIYHSSQGELIREWLSERNLTYFYYWHDSKTHKIQFKEGKPVERQRDSLKRRAKEKNVKSDCVHFLARDDVANFNPEQGQGFTISELGAAVFHKGDEESHNAHQGRFFQTGDLVYWGTSIGEWIIEHVEGDVAHIKLVKHAGYNTKLIKPIRELRYSRSYW